MATQTITVCDVCGAPATAETTIDVCKADLRKLDGNVRERQKLPKVKCSVCGKRITSGAGMAAHLRAHENGGAS